MTSRQRGFYYVYAKDGTVLRKWNCIAKARRYSQQVPGSYIKYDACACRILNRRRATTAVALCKRHALPSVPVLYQNGDRSVLGTHTDNVDYTVGTTGFVALRVTG